jgi:hypothetical protein
MGYLSAHELPLVGLRAISGSCETQAIAHPSV